MNTLDIVQRAQTKRFTTLHKRMDDDAKLAYLDPYYLLDSQGRKINDAVSITMNDPAVFAHAIASILINGKWQTTVEGDISGTQTHKIENFLEDCDITSESKYPKGGISGIHVFHCNQICIRGWIGERVLWLVDDKGNTYPDILPMDMRYFVYERGRVGFNWGCYLTYRTPELVKLEYPDVKGITGSEDEVQVYDYWDDKVNEVWIADVKVYSQKNELGYPPFVLQPVPEGFMLLDKGYQVREGESLFFLDRALYPELNRLMSIDQTLAMKMIRPPYQKQEAEITDTNPGYPGGIGQVKKVLPDEKYELIPQPDINKGSEVAHQNIYGAIQRGGVNNIDLGNIQQQTSAIWITEQSEIRNKLLVPRQDTLAKLKADRAAMLLDQLYNNEMGELELGKAGKRRSYGSEVIGDPETYNVSYRLMTKDKKQEIANIAIADAAKGKLSRDTILRDIIKLDDVEGEVAKLNSDDAENFDPVIKFMRITFGLIAEAEELPAGTDKDQKVIEAKRLANKCVSLIKQEQMSVMQPPQGQTGMAQGQPQGQKGNQAMALNALPKLGVGV
jgi:hypothetical protein